MGKATDDPAIGGLDGDLPRAINGVPGIHAQVHQHLLDLNPVSLCRPKPRIDLSLDFNIWKLTIFQ